MSGKSIAIAAFILLSQQVALPQPATFMPPGSPASGGIVDLVLIYQGGAHRAAWTPERFQPYLSWLDPASGKEEWLFDGFLFIEFKDGMKHEYAKGYGLQPARKQEWTWYLDRLFEKGVSLSALDARIEQTIARLGAPKRPRRVVLTLPEPIAGQTDWGEFEGRALDFTRQADRVAACQWYLGEIKQRWERAGLRHLELVGIYWVAEHTKGDGERILPDVARIVHDQNLKFFWIPYWNAPGAQNWRELGFDMAYQQPNHFFHPEVADSRLDEAVAFAKRFAMGMEMEWDGRAIQNKVTFSPRFSSYLSVYKDTGVIEHAALAHYEGGGALGDLSKSGDPDLHPLYNRYCAEIASRQRSADAGKTPAQEARTTMDSDIETSAPRKVD
ncbi:MAG: DUF4855 domain-containing protein [bacterium]